MIQYPHQDLEKVAVEQEIEFEVKRDKAVVEVDTFTCAFPLPQLTNTRARAEYRQWAAG